MLAQYRFIQTKPEWWVQSSSSNRLLLKRLAVIKALIFAGNLRFSYALPIPLSEAPNPRLSTQI